MITTTNDKVGSSPKKNLTTFQSASEKRKTFKKGIDFESARQRRSSDGIELRKHRRLEALQKKRRSISQTDSPTICTTSTNCSHMDTDAICTASNPGKELSIPHCLSHVYLNISDSVLQLITRSNTNHSESPSDSSTITKKLPVDVQTSATLIDSVTQSGIIPHLVLGLTVDDLEIRSQSAICIGNIAGEMPELRDLVIQFGAISPILDNIITYTQTNDKVVETFIWSLSNICRGKQTAAINTIIPVIPILVNQIHTTSHQEILLNSCWALAYLSEENDTVSQSLVEQYCLANKIVTLLSNPNTHIAYVALRILGNFVLWGYVASVIDAGIFNYTKSLYTNQDKNVSIEMYYFLSLIAESGTESIDVLLNSSSSDLQIICNTMIYSSLNERMEAIWVIFNIAKYGTDEQLKSLVDIGAIPALCHNLKVPDIKFILLVLESIENILMVGDRLALDFRVLFDECGGRETIESMLMAENDSVYRMANAIYEEFFEESNTSTEEWDEYWS